MNNMERLPADAFFLDLELRQEVERMASLGYAPDDIASYLGLDAEGKGPPCIPLCAREH